jgi:hypothetical protein
MMLVANGGAKVDANTDKALDDWGWWVRARSVPRYRCRSIEGRYRPERVPGDDERTASRVVDERLCLAVERAVCQPGFPDGARVILKGWYVQRTSREKIAAKAGFPRVVFADRLAWAVAVLRNRLSSNCELIA